MGCVAKSLALRRYLTTFLVLIFFEYLITVDQEVTLFWGKRLTGAVTLFFANRYTTIIYTIYYILLTLVPAIVKTPQVSVYSS